MWRDSCKDGTGKVEVFMRRVIRPHENGATSPSASRQDICETNTANFCLECGKATSYLLRLHNTDSLPNHFLNVPGVENTLQVLR